LLSIIIILQGGTGRQRHRGSAAGPTL